MAAFHVGTDAIALRFESRLAVPAAQVWQWITSVEGIRAELRPLLRMTAPKGVRSLGDMPITPGVPLFRSWILLFGFVPIDYTDLTLLELEPGSGFVEQSAMRSMRLWRHERRIAPRPSHPGMVLLVDQLHFQPRMAGPLVAWFVRRLFAHRHAVLRARAERLLRQR
jgi:hypothetical protein